MPALKPSFGASKRLVSGSELASIALSLSAFCSNAHAAERYTFELVGAPSDLQARLLEISNLAQEKGALVTSAAISRAGQRDASAIENALRASGYYKATASLEIVSSEDAEKLAVTINAEPGEKFRITEHLFVYLDSSENERPTTPEMMALDFSENTDGTSLAANQRQAVEGLWGSGYPEARPVGRRVELLPGDAEARAIYELESGPRANLGPLELTGLERTRPGYIEKLKTWEDGETFDQAKLIEFQDRLVATNIFNQVNVAPGPLGDDGTAAVQTDLTERAPRTFGVGLSFSTVEGVGGRLFLEYRSIFGAGESARFDIAVNEIRQEATLTFNKPFPTLPGAAFASAGFLNETTDAFDARTVSASVGVSKRWFDDRLDTRAGLGFETTRIETETTDERNFFASLPLSAVWNTETDPLALSDGEQVSLYLTPFLGSEFFTQADLLARTRYNFGENDKYTVAGRIRLGSIFGTAFEDVPINRRFFSGGGSSVRGFDFQAVGPLDEDNNPTGGRSVIEAAIETRAKVTETIQAAAFIDTGSVSENSLPDFAGDYFVGVGVGARYLSAIGPLRVDFALPLERRSSDRAWQLYISLGQPF
ncbi:MAG: BamA/TamA family outer membrane protein [Pseudomonadota bacterium]